MLRAVLLSLCAAASQAYVLTGMAIKSAPPLARATTPQAMLPNTNALATVSMPTTMALADDNTLLLGSGGLIFAIFLFAVVGTVVINFGIRKK